MLTSDPDRLVQETGFLFLKKLENTKRVHKR